MAGDDEHRIPCGKCAGDMAPTGEVQRRPGPRSQGGKPSIVYARLYVCQGTCGRAEWRAFDRDDGSERSRG